MTARVERCNTPAEATAVDEDLEPLAVPRDIDLKGCVLAGRFRVEKYLDRGGMGTVWVARDLKLGRAAVVKVPRPEYLEDQQFRARFEREVRTLIQFEHPNIVAVYDYGTFVTDVSGQPLAGPTDDATTIPFVALQYLPGGSLKDRIARDGGKQTPRQILPWLRAVASALDFMHSQDAIHRDVKPANVLYDRSGHVRLADFGIAKALGKADSQLTSSSGSPGTPAYMAPEIVKRDRSVHPLIGPRYDQYSLAVMTYQALSGRLPHEADSALEMLLMKSSEPPRPLNEFEPGVPPRICSALMKALARNPADRFETCAALADEFAAAIAKEPETALEPDPDSGTRRGWKKRWVAAALGVVLVASAILWKILDRDDVPQTRMTLSIEHEDGSRVPEEGLVVIDHAGTRLRLVSDRDSASARAQVERGAEYVTPTPRGDHRGWDLDVKPPNQRTSVLVHVTLSDGQTALSRFQIEEAAPTADAPSAESNAPDKEPPTISLQRLDGGSVANEARIEFDPLDRVFTLDLSDARSGIDDQSLVLDGFDETSRRGDRDGLHVGIRLRASRFEIPARVRVSDRVGNVASLAASFTFRIPVPVARIRSLDPVVKDSSATHYLVKGWSTRITLTSALGPELGADWFLSLENPQDGPRAHDDEASRAGPFVLTAAKDELSGRIDLPESMRIEGHLWLVVLSIRDRDRVEKTGLADATIAFDGTAPDLTIERTVADRSEPVADGASLECKVEDLRVRASDVDGPIDVEALVDGVSAIRERNASPATVQLSTMQLSSGSHALEIHATDHAGNLATRKFVVTPRVEAARPVTTSTVPVKTPAWAVAEAEAPDATVIVDAATRKAIVDCGLAWRVRDRASGIVLLLVPPGRYRRGAIPGDKEAIHFRDFELPAHDVEVPRPFYFGWTEVTNAQYRGIPVDADHPCPPCTEPGFGADDQPAVGVSWHDAVRFCSHFDMRLPRDEEWEYACRAGTRTKYWWGDDVLKDVVYDNLYDTAARNEDVRIGRSNATTPVPWDDGAATTSACDVGRPNPWGFLHFAGNASEWTASAFDPREYQRRSEGDDSPRSGADDSSTACIRGGSWHSGLATARSSYRGQLDRNARRNSMGFRVARDP